MRRNRYEEEEYRTRCWCPDCGDMGAAWSPDWEYCPFCGEVLVSQMELDDMADEARADADRKERSLADDVWDLGVALNRMRMES